VLIDDSGRVLFVHGETWKYLQLAQGKLTTSILEMAREGIRPTLTNIINEVLAKGETVSREGARSKVNGYILKVKITVKPIASTPRGPRKLAVIFEDIIQQRKRSKKGEITEPDSRVKELEQELQYTRENLRSTVEELETANEELRSANEEYQSTNEELQSTNEELETSREELQSVNEELVTVNSEFQKKIEELSTINDEDRKSVV
jgi:two-component system CheB/CheR fusion protein